MSDWIKKLAGDNDESMIIWIADAKRMRPVGYVWPELMAVVRAAAREPDLYMHPKLEAALAALKAKVQFLSASALEAE